MPLIRNISDTARWAAIYRARECERPNPLFKDPFARRLAGERGEQIAKSLKHSEKNAWSWIARTYLFDQFIETQIQRGCKMVINLAAGLDARPYRLALPATLRWIEIDLPEIIDYKEEILRDEKPACRLERFHLDLSHVNERRKLFQQLGAGGGPAVIVSEGLIIYLTENEVGSIGGDLAEQPAFQHWVLDLASPPLLKMLQKTIGKPLEEAAAPLLFGPAEGPDFFRQFGWEPEQVRSLFHAAGELKRLPPLFSILYRFQKSDAFNPKRPWGGVCSLRRIDDGQRSAVSSKQ